MKKKILYMTMIWGYGGIEQYMMNIFDHIDKNRYTLDVALPGKYKHQNEDALIERGIHVIHYPVNSMIQQIKAIKRILDIGDYDIVHVMQSYVTLELYTVFALVAIAERKKHHYKVICHSHGTEDRTREAGSIKKTLRKLYRFVLRAGHSKADLLAGCSQEAGDFLYGKDAGVEIFCNGIMLDKFAKKESPQTIAMLREKYKLQNGTPNFVIVARMVEEKNPFFAIDVLECLCRYYPHISFTWVGDGPMRKDIEQYIGNKELTDRILLLGKQNNVQEILACSDYLLLPSIREGAPLALIEAQAVGLKCFVSDGVPNIIDCGGVTFIELDKTAEQWAEEIRRHIECSPKAEINERLLKRFDVNETVKTLSQVYDRLVESKS